MKILVTGSKGFIGKHMTLALKGLKHDVFEYDIDKSIDDLKEYISKCDFIIHLAGINRPMDVKEFYDGNANFTKRLVDLIKESNRNIPIIMSSSIQARLDNDYGKSKKMGEDYLLSSGLPVYVYRLANVFGKWCKPNYNSACATFCYNIAHDLDVYVRDKDYVVTFNYIDDIVSEFINKINDNKGSKDILYVKPTYECSLGRLVDLLRYFKSEVESDRHLPLIHDDFELKLFKTFLSYLSDEGYTFNFAKDDRGSFEELYKSKRFGQISENIAFRGITKGGHYHTYKKEIFYVVKGKCEIVQRNINNDDLIKDIVSDKDLKPIDINVGYTHEITNIGNCPSHTLMWISEIYSDKTPDTFKEPVHKNG